MVRDSSAKTTARVELDQNCRSEGGAMTRVDPPASLQPSTARPITTPRSTSESAIAVNLTTAELFSRTLAELLLCWTYSSFA